MAEKKGEIEKEMTKDAEGYVVPAFMYNEGEIHWFKKVNGEIVYLSIDREIITDPIKIEKFLIWQTQCEERIKSMRNKTVDDIKRIRYVPAEVR